MHIKGLMEDKSGDEELAYINLHTDNRGDQAAVY